ncbi:methyltransferase [Shewanella gaetbuli]
MSNKNTADVEQQMILTGLSEQMKGDAEQLSQLSSLLFQTQSLWKVVAFDYKDLPWKQNFPALCDALWQIDDNEIEAIDACSNTLVARLLPYLIKDYKAQHNETLIPLLTLLDDDINKTVAKTSSGLCSAPQPVNPTITETEMSHFNAGIKARKWQQIRRFTQKVFVPKDNLPVLEWCAGKGYLGRWVAKSQQVPVTSLEWQKSLCEQGRIFAQKWQLPQQFICADAFAPIDLNNEQSAIKKHQHAIALHACGDLHVRLLTLASKVGTQQISISPCCYHLIEHQYYQALSTVAQDSRLQLSRHDLQLPLQQSVIANRKQNDLRKKEIAWRLGFDCLQRDINQVDRYLPIPTIKQSQLSGRFSDFCLWAAEQKNVPLTKNTLNEAQYQDYLQQGLLRQKVTQRIDLVRHLFRQPIEQWLLLDRVCFLQQHGYQVELSEFCSEDITPRNALIHAKKVDLV